MGHLKAQFIVFAHEPIEKHGSLSGSIFLIYDRWSHFTSSVTASPDQPQTGAMGHFVAHIIVFAHVQIENWHFLNFINFVP